jgi:hypothetical protein
MLLLGYNWGQGHGTTVKDYRTTKQQTHAAELSD